MAIDLFWEVGKGKRETMKKENEKKKSKRESTTHLVCNIPPQFPPQSSAIPSDYKSEIACLLKISAPSALRAEMVWGYETLQIANASLVLHHSRLHRHMDSPGWQVLV